MQVQNNQLCNVQFMARTNPGEMVSFKDDNGNKITREAQARIELISIPPMSTVEIEDKLWLAATNSKTRIKLFDEEEEDIIGAKIGDKQLTRIVRMPTGKTKEISLIEVAIEARQLTIIKPVLTKAEAELEFMVEFLREKGILIPKATPLKEIKELYKENEDK